MMCSRDASSVLETFIFALLKGNVLQMSARLGCLILLSKYYVIEVSGPLFSLLGFIARIFGGCGC